MKVNVDKTIEVTDERRKQIALAIDGLGSKKRDATREELKHFLWENGANWEIYLDQVLAGEETNEAPVSEPDEDVVADGLDLI